MFIDWFDPGYKAGGPIRSAVNFVRHMQHDYNLYVFTGDRDLDALSPYENVQLNEWVTYDERVKVFYCPRHLLGMGIIKKVIEDLNPSSIYLNGMFSRYFTIYPCIVSLKTGRKIDVVLVPHGMLRVSALQYKSLKKRVYLNLFKLLGFSKRITFQATDSTEYEDILKTFGKSTSVYLASNWPGYIPAYSGSIAKLPGELKIVFIGRLHRIKNLDYLIECLIHVKGNIELTVIGSEEDKTYVNHCRAIAVSCPENVQVNFAGEVDNGKIPGIIARHHLFSLPTQGENYGYAIFEALAGGKPVLISDQTPWQDLQMAYAGWDLPLNEPQQFKNALQLAVDFGQSEYDKWSFGAWQYVSKAINTSELREAYQKLFN